MKLKNQIAILTGDVVKSSLLNKSEIKYFQEKIENYPDNDILLRPHFFKGDSFQLAVKLESALLLALKIRLEMKQWKAENDVRIAIGIGEITHWNTDVLLARGSAFERSNKSLDQLKGLGLNVSIVTGNPELDDELETYCYMVDEFIKNQTRLQAKITLQMLDGTPQTEIAKILDISESSVSESLKAANWKLVERLFKRYERIIQINK